MCKPTLTGQRRFGPVVVIGSGIGGLATAVPLAAAGCPVTILERADSPGGKMRQVDGVDAGPTVLTLRWVFEALFASAGARLENHLELVPQEILARHFWPDGAQLDLFAEHEASAEAIREFTGARGESEFRAFSARAKRLFAAFLEPMMLAAEPDPLALAQMVAGNPRLLSDMAPWRSLDGLLRQSFSDQRLRQLFGRYATYVGGDPKTAPALLALIWEAEAAGVWAVSGGLSALARSLADLITANGGAIHYGAHVAAIEADSDGVTGVRLADGRMFPAAQVVFNGDPRALSDGALGPAAQTALPDLRRRKRALSAYVWSFRAALRGRELVHHNVFFRDAAAPEFAALAQGQTAQRPTIYLCAEDRGLGHPAPSEERIELIVNASPLRPLPQANEELDQCRIRTFGTLRSHGLTIDPLPGRGGLSTPRDFETLFPGSCGSLYGQSPQGLTSALSRPRARTRLPGLYLCGGGVHPGPGVPMAALSGRHAAAAILTDRASTSRSRRTATPGGMSTASATMAPAQSPSSPS